MAKTFLGGGLSGEVTSGSKVILGSGDVLDDRFIMSIIYVLGRGVISGDGDILRAEAFWVMKTYEVAKSF